MAHLCVLPGVVIFDVRDGGGCVCAEPIADSPTDASGAFLGKSVIWISGESGEFFVDHFGGEYGGEFGDFGICRHAIAPVIDASSRMVRSDLFDNRISFLRLLRPVAKNAFPHLSKPAVCGAGTTVSVDLLDFAADGGGTGIIVAFAAALARRDGVHRPAVRQSRGTAPGDAGIRAGVYLRGTSDDQAGAGSAGNHSAAGNETAGGGSDGQFGNAAERGAGAVPGTEADATARAGNAGKSGTGCGLAEPEYSAVSGTGCGDEELREGAHDQLVGRNDFNLSATLASWVY